MTETQPHASDDAVGRGADATLREIRQQPDVWRETARIIHERRLAIDEFLKPLLAPNDLRVIFTGAGTSAFAGDVVAPTIARATGRRIESIATTDIVSNPRHYLAHDIPTLLVSLARSGNSPESVAATRLADRMLQNAHHIVITCNANGMLGQEHAQNPHSLVLHMPPRAHDQGFAMTSSFTSMTLAALLVFLGDDAERVEALARAAHSIIDDDWDKTARLATPGIDRLVYLGSGPLAGLAQEAALKLLELTAGRVVSYHDSMLGFRHGPKAVLNDETLAVLFLSTDSYTRSYDLDTLSELRAALGTERAVAIASDAQDGIAAIVLEGLEGVDDGYLAVVYVVVAQILALSFSLRDGNTPDNPFPGGAVNRVVKGVRIHEFDVDVPRRC